MTRKENARQVCTSIACSQSTQTDAEDPGLLRFYFGLT